jgi:hypothetical protein
MISITSGENAALEKFFMARHWQRVASAGNADMNRTFLSKGGEANAIRGDFGCRRCKRGRAEVRHFGVGADGAGTCGRLSA